MATIPVFTSFTSGTVVTATQLNTQIVQAGNFDLARPYCNAYNSAGVSTATGVFTLVPFDSELEDNDGMHSVGSNTSRMTCVTPGLFSLSACSSWPTGTTGERGLQLRLNAAGSNSGGTLLTTRSAAPQPSTGNYNFPELNIFYRYNNVGDYLELFVRQQSGGTVTTATGSYNLYLSALWEIA